MAERDVILTFEGKRKLQEELEHLRTIARKEAADKIREALSFGDAWGNPEYETAKREQAFIEGRIKTLETMLRDATVLEAPPTATGEVVVGSWVSLRDLEAGETISYQIVGTAESDPIKNRISYVSPLGKAVVGRKKGERVDVQAPAGVIRYEITDVRASLAQAE